MISALEKERQTQGQIASATRKDVLGVNAMIIHIRSEKDEPKFKE